MKKKKRLPVDDGWGIGPEDEGHEAKVSRYNEPITEHVCDTGCRTVRNWHEQEEIFDDFELSLRKRELAHSMLIESKGHELKERRCLRRFISTRTGLYILRLETVQYSLIDRHLGDIEFDDEDEQIEYYNYCIGVFGFTEVERINAGWDIDEDSDGWDIDDDEFNLDNW